MDATQKLAELLYDHWPYKPVTGIVTWECQLCHCLVVNRHDHAINCLNSLDDEEKRVMSEELRDLFQRTQVKP